VRVIDENGEQRGIMRTREALALARNLNLDLVEVAPNAQPPVCRLLDYGKYRYEQDKKEKEARKSQKTIVVKEIRFSPKIDDHDIETKGKQARSFLEEGHKVKMSVRFRGREMAHQEIGREVLNQVLEMLKDVVAVEQMPRVEGRNMTMLISRAAAKSEQRPVRPMSTPAPAPGASAPRPDAPAPRPVVERQAASDAAQPAVAEPASSPSQPTDTPTQQ
jgi:translation initiation factor IF-3